MKDSEQHPAPVPGIEDAYADRTPSAAAEERAVAEWRRTMGGGQAGGPQERALTPTGSGVSWSHRLRPIAAAAAAILLFGAGWGVGRLDAVAAGPNPAGYMLMLWEGPGFDPGPDPSRLVGEYGAWMREAGARGADITGAELLDPAGVGAPGSAPATAAEDSRPSGFFIVDVPTRDDAIRLATEHPHIGYGGWIEVWAVR